MEEDHDGLYLHGVERDAGCNHTEDRVDVGPHNGYTRTTKGLVPNTVFSQLTGSWSQAKGLTILPSILCSFGSIFY